MPHPCTVYLVDDDEDLIVVLTSLLESMNYEVKSFTSGQDFLNLKQLSRPSCILLDVRMPRMSGLELQDILLARQETTPIIFMSGHADMLTVLRAMKSGALEFLLKPVNDQVLLESINKAILHDVHQHFNQQQRDNAFRRFAPLTSREHDILQFLVLNFSSKAIAKQLSISPNTVDLHRAKIIKKIKARSLIDVINLAWCAGIVDSKRYFAMEKTEEEVV